MTAPAVRIPGLKNESAWQLVQIFQKYLQVRKVILFGSRAKQTQKLNSDIDLCIKDSFVDLSVVLKIETEIDDLLLPYKVDLCIYEKIENRELREHIDRVGKVLFLRNSSNKGMSEIDE